MSIYKDLLEKKKSISVTGLGYVGLPLALEFAKHFRVIAFDINADRVEKMRNGIDPSQEIDLSAYPKVDIHFTSDPEDLRDAHFHIVGVPTDIDEHQVPDLMPLQSASRSVGSSLKRGDYVIYESTVYPGCTEEDCVPILEESSGLKMGVDFKVGYSPERIVPGDKVRTLTTILKIVSGNDSEALEEIAQIYGHIITAGVHKASSIKVAEAAKVIENTQRDINISLMNELAIIFDRMGISTREVIEAAGTKWNFHQYYPGLVGGHCISVDPFYLMHKAKELGHDPQVIAAGRRVNDYMPEFIAKKLVQALIDQGQNPGECKVLVMGITFKENVADIRNTKVVDLIAELEGYSLDVDVVDPYADPAEVRREYDIELRPEPGRDYHAVVIAVGHEDYGSGVCRDIHALFKTDRPVVFDLKGNCASLKDDPKLQYWRL